MRTVAQDGKSGTRSRAYYHSDTVNSNSPLVAEQLGPTIGALRKLTMKGSMKNGITVQRTIVGHTILLLGDSGSFHDQG